MGWNRIAEDLEVTGTPPGDFVDGAELWSRGGLDGVYVQVGGQQIHLPREALEDLFSSEYVSQRIRQFESMDTEQAMKHMMRSTSFGS